MCKQLEERLRLLDSQGLVREYAYLAALPRLSETQKDRVGQILELAQSDGVLDRWIDEIEHFLGHIFKHLNTEGLTDLDNQAALLREYLGSNLTEDLYLVITESVRQ
jgi:hypothetical protein